VKTRQVGIMKMNECDHIIGMHYNYDETDYVRESENELVDELFLFCPVCGVKVNEI
jgi:hypothetical protein